MSTPSIRRFLLGAPLHSGSAGHQRLNKLIALPVFSSDALSSVAYATQEAMIALAIAGSMAFQHTLAVASVIVALLIILTVSYNQTIHAYPNGGGAYIVARENLGILAAEVAAVALLTDYILTVAVSVSSGVDAILSAYPHINVMPMRLSLNVCATLFIMVMNLRGVKESGAAFALPTYCFILSIVSLVAIGVWQALHPSLLHPMGFAHLPSQHVMYPVAQTLGLWVLMRAFASGCTAVTGVEAISNGIPAFRPPEAHNAAVTMRWMAGILAVMFIGISYLAERLGHFHSILVSDSGETVVSQVAHAVVGTGTFYYIIQWSTFMVLILAANTSFADFPRLAAIAARDRRLPRWFSALGDRLVFQNGIIALALLAITLELCFKGSTDALIPLYAIGVFLAFTLSQSGMVVRWLRLRSPGWRWRSCLNGLGAALTAIVAVVFAVVKFQKGAWIVLVIMPLMVLMLSRIDQHYQFVRRRLRIMTYRPPREPRPITALVLVSQLDASTQAAAEYAQLITKDVRALCLPQRDGGAAALQAAWCKMAPDIPLGLPLDPRGGWRAALMDELYTLRNEDRNRIYMVILPRNLQQGRGSAADYPRSHGRRITWLLKWMLLHEPGIALADTSSLIPCETAVPAAVPAAVPEPACVPAIEDVVAEPCQRLLRLDGGAPAAVQFLGYRPDHHTVLVLVPGFHRGIVEALSFARQLGGDVRALHIELEPERTEDLRKYWNEWAQGIPLIVMESPYRQLREPLIHYVRVTRQQQKTEILTVVVPEFVATHWWNKALHNQSGLLLKFALQKETNVVVVNTRYFLDR